MANSCRVFATSFSPTGADVISWPAGLVREVAKRRCAFFLGAGVSATAANPTGVRPKDWGEFLQEACTLVQVPDKRMQIEALVSEKRYLLASGDQNLS